MEFNLNNNLVKFLIVAVVLIFIIGISFFLLNPSSEQPIQDKNKYASQIANGKEIYFEKLCFVDVMGGEKRETQTYVLKKQVDLEVFISSVQQKCGNVDFNQYILVGASLKYSSKGGGGSRGITVSKIIESNDKIFVVLYTNELPVNAITTAAVSHPLSLYKIKKTDKQIIFVE